MISGVIISIVLISSELNSGLMVYSYQTLIPQFLEHLWMEESSIFNRWDILNVGWRQRKIAKHYSWSNIVRDKSTMPLKHNSWYQNFKFQSSFALSVHSFFLPCGETTLKGISIITLTRFPHGCKKRMHTSKQMDFSRFFDTPSTTYLGGFAWEWLDKYCEVYKSKFDLWRRIANLDF